MKPHVKEILKNKSDKMVDLIVDDIGLEGEKNMSTSFIEKGCKYVLQIAIKSGDPETTSGFIDTESLPSRVDDLEENFQELSEKAEEVETRVIVLEDKEISNTLFDDLEIQERLKVIEQALNITTGPIEEPTEEPTEEPGEDGDL